MRPAFAEQLNPDSAVKAPSRGKKILVVDDNPIVLKTLSLGLGARGYEMITAAGASEAIAAVHVEKPDLIILDIFFPPDVVTQGGMGWDGFRMIEWFIVWTKADTFPPSSFPRLTPYNTKTAALLPECRRFCKSHLRHATWWTPFKTFLATNPLIRR